MARLDNLGEGTAGVHDSVSEPDAWHPERTGFITNDLLLDLLLRTTIRKPVTSVNLFPSLANTRGTSRPVFFS